ncbi:C-type lectin domain family 10 member A-like [Hippocampus zosterae]|uniref:C-type lectin domain family 10 member A-like n=1 Tax=Hippocampus zosterae TaxID=109293 RepID=UPI00223D48EF|nr:C-type lectin domain family 10 member A-like [Hippocampus zosterae]
MDNQTEEPENVVDEQQVDEPAVVAPTTGAAQDSVEEPDRPSAEGMETSVGDAERLSMESIKMSVGDSKRLSADSIEMSVLYDASIKDEASKCNVTSWVSGRVFCCFAGFALILICTLAGWYINDSKLDQMKEQLKARNMLLNKLVKNIESTQQQVDLLQQRYKHLRDEMNAIETKVNAASEIQSSLLKKIPGLQANFEQLNATANFYSGALRSMKVAIEECQWHLSDGLKLPTDLMYTLFCGKSADLARLQICCKEGWVRHNLHCYVLSTQEKRWSDAERDCKEKDGEFVEIHNPREQKFLTKLLLEKAGANYDAWIGLSYQDGGYKWSDDRPLSNVSFWKADDGRAVEDARGSCVAIKHSPGAAEDSWDHNWDPFPCAARKRYLCRTCIFCEKGSKQ